MGNMKAKLAAKENLGKMLDAGVLKVEETGAVVITKATGGTSRTIKRVLEPSQVVGKHGPAIKESAVTQLHKRGHEYFPEIDLTQGYEALVAAIRAQTEKAVL